MTKILLAILLTRNALNAETIYDLIGLRIRFGEESETDIENADIFTEFETPWSSDVCEDCNIALNGELAIGAIEGDNQTTATGHLGIIARLAPQGLSAEPHSLNRPHPFLKESVWATGYRWELPIHFWCRL